MKPTSQFHKQIFEGHKGKVLLELTKSYKGDARFKLDERFEDDLDVQKLPQKFKQIAEKGIIEKVTKKKKMIHKQKPLLLQRFQPGTVQGEKIVKKAEGIKKYEQGLRRHQDKLNKQLKVQKGIDKVKLGQKILAQQDEPIVENKVEFKVVVNGNRKQAFKPTQFKLFG